MSTERKDTRLWQSLIKIKKSHPDLDIEVAYDWGRTYNWYLMLAGVALPDPNTLLALAITGASLNRSAVDVSEIDIKSRKFHKLADNISQQIADDLRRED
jgi:hypothetical protein